MEETAIERQYPKASLETLLRRVDEITELRNNATTEQQRRSCETALRVLEVLVLEARSETP